MDNIARNGHACPFTIRKLATALGADPKELLPD